MCAGAQGGGARSPFQDLRPLLWWKGQGMLRGQTEEASSRGRKEGVAYGCSQGSQFSGQGRRLLAEFLTSMGKSVPVTDC